MGRQGGWHGVLHLKVSRHVLNEGFKKARLIERIMFNRTLAIAA